jgi:ubiquinone/menaquinone biosynthesis C-methylase UbiE
VQLSDVLLPNQEAERLSPGIWSTLPSQHQADGYDRMAGTYDRVVGNALYNRLVWGASVQDYADAARDGLQAAGKGAILDCGCGSLVFTAKPYQIAPLDRMILFDRSLGMMRRGAVRLPGGRFLQGDAFDMPFRGGSFDTVFAWGFLHVVGTKSPLLTELRRVAAPGATITLSSLVLTKRRIGNKLLAFLHRQGEAATPESVADVTDAFSERFELTSQTLHGSMLVLSGRACG